MYAEIIAIGPFSEAIVDSLEYPADSYTKTNNGAIICMMLFGITEGTELSKAFAKIMGITDTWDFNQHQIISTNIDFLALVEFGNTYPDYNDDVNTLKTLSNNGFQFHFLING